MTNSTEPRASTSPRWSTTRPSIGSTAFATEGAALATGAGPEHAGEVVLFVSSNGAGVGHLMRLMSMARRASPAVRPLFVTMSQALPVVHRMGYTAEYVPSYGYIAGRFDITHGEWHRLFHARLAEIVERHRPAALVFDGTWPYDGLLRLGESHPDLDLVWSRRAMWRSDTETPQLASAPHFDLILEPGEYAREVDTGPTSRRRDEVVDVDPILYLDHDELLPADEARAELGLDPERTTVLVQLGAGNINDISSVLGTVVRRLAEEPGVQPALAESAISVELAGELDVHRFSAYPLARYLHAFDLAVSASGYNTFHELVASGTPTIFIPNLETRADDQAARSAYAERRGVGIHLPDPTPEAFDAALRRLLDPDERAGMFERARETFPGNGARQAMAAIEELAASRGRSRDVPVDGDLPEPPGAPDPAPGPTSPDDGLDSLPRHAPQRVAHGVGWRSRRAYRATVAWLRTVLAALKSTAGRVYDALPEPLQRPFHPLIQRLRRRRRQRRPDRLLVLLRDEDRALEVIDLVEERRLSHRFQPIYVIFSDDLGPLRHRGIPFECVWPRERWAAARTPGSWDDYVGDRLTTLGVSWEIDHVVDVPPGVPLAVTTGAVDAVIAQLPARAG